jgi:hypothetical protein
MWLCEKLRIRSAMRVDSADSRYNINLTRFEEANTTIKGTIMNDTLKLSGNTAQYLRINTISEGENSSR